MQKKGNLGLFVGCVCLVGLIALFSILYFRSTQVSVSEKAPSSESQKETFQYESDHVEIDDSGGTTKITITGTPKKQGAVYQSKGCIELKRSAYVACYNTETKVADWTEYALTQQDLRNDISRDDDFRADPDLRAGQRSELVDYRGSGYDRGHLVPAADMARGRVAMSESFLLTNMGPQAPSVNRGIWSKLEAQVREWAKEGKSLRVITGPLYFGNDSNSDGVPEISTIGRGKVFVPSHYFKIILKIENIPQNDDVIAFAVPNWEVDGGKLENYLISVDDIESITGLDFLKDLDDSIEVPLEIKKQTGLDSF
ncbi:MAG TPA: DNA/RNA non-specific endonuclease [Candidatus Omnitrophota bacterium]|nr:DNA/RNA non-specific endonuclease [Candidatus Omnitrophota bacterium]